MCLCVCAKFHPVLGVMGASEGENRSLADVLPQDKEQRAIPDGIQEMVEEIL